MQISLLILAGLILAFSGAMALFAYHSHFWQEEWKPFALASAAGVLTAMALGYLAVSL